MRFIALTTLIGISCGCKSQKLDNGCWLPETYVDYLVKHSFKNIASTLKPVHSVYVSADTIQIMSYQGDYLTAETKMINNRLEVINFSNVINLSYPEAINYTRKKCFLYQSGDHLMMDVGDETIRFVNNKDGVDFKNPSDVYFRYKVSDKYLLENHE
jgi:hypothetical protein